MVEAGDLTIEPEMNAGDGRRLEMAELFAQRCGFWALREHAIEAFEGQRQD